MVKIEKVLHIIRLDKMIPALVLLVTGFSIRLVLPASIKTLRLYSGRSDRKYCSVFPRLLNAGCLPPVELQYLQQYRQEPVRRCALISRADRRWNRRPDSCLAPCLVPAPGGTSLGSFWRYFLECRRAISACLVHCSGGAQLRPGETPVRLSSPPAAAPEC